MMSCLVQEYNLLNLSYVDQQFKNAIRTLVGLDEPCIMMYVKSYLFMSNADLKTLNHTLKSVIVIPVFRILFARCVKAQIPPVLLTCLRPRPETIILSVACLRKL